MLLILMLEAAAISILLIVNRGKYLDLMDPGSVKNKIALILMPTAAFLAEKIFNGRFYRYERKLDAKLSELNGGRHIRDRLRSYLAEKMLYMIIAVFAVTLLGSLMEKPDTGYWIFAAVVLLLAFQIPDRTLDEKIKKRNFYIQYDFPDFLNKLVLLINAGMTVNRAWEKIVCDRKTITPLYEELVTTYLEIKNGKSEAAAYEDFARRCRVKEITKFVAAIIQNLKKGNAEMVALLKLQSNECWQLRKNMARKLGEEASTKLVLPLMIMFVGILIIVVLPAVMQMKYL